MPPSFEAVRNDSFAVRRNSFATRSSLRNIARSWPSIALRKTVAACARNVCRNATGAGHSRAMISRAASTSGPTWLRPMPIAFARA